MIGVVAVTCAGCQTHFLFRFMQVDRRLPQAASGTDRYHEPQMPLSGFDLRTGTGASAEPLVEPWRGGTLARAFVRFGYS